MLWGISIASLIQSQLVARHTRYVISSIDFKEITDDKLQDKSGVKLFKEQLF